MLDKNKLLNLKKNQTDKKLGRGKIEPKKIPQKKTSFSNLFFS